jgi:hypothetical protein
MNKQGMERLNLTHSRTTSMGFDHIRTLSFLSLVSGSLLLSGCMGADISKTNSPQSRYLYDAPAQAYTLDLGAQNFRGNVRLRDSCTPEGSSLNIYDNAGRFFRIDAVNLINNPNIVLPEFADDTTTRDVIFRYYMEKVNPGGRILLQRNVNSRMGSALYATVESEIHVKDPNKDLNTTRYMGYLIVRRGNIGYVLQHEQKFYRSDRMLEILGLLASEIQVPGRLPTNKKQEDNPLYIDLKNSTPEQIEDWKKAAQCGDASSTKWLSFGSKNATAKKSPAAEQAPNPDNTESVDYSQPADTDSGKGSVVHRMYSKIAFWKK